MITYKRAPDFQYLLHTLNPLRSRARKNLETNGIKAKHHCASGKCTGVYKNKLTEFNGCSNKLIRLVYKLS